MRIEGYVSLWIGKCESADRLSRFMKIEYSEAGEFIPPPFAHAFGISYFDEDFNESNFYDQPTKSLKELLAGFSYDDVIIPRFCELCGEDTLTDEANAVILLYNFEYNEEINEAQKDSNFFRFIGSVEYR